MGKKSKTRYEYFQEKVQLDPVTGCWLWIGHVTIGGYGQFWDGQRVVGAHVFSYRHHKGELPDRTEPDHLCRNRACVNPDHLEAVTRQVNLLRGDTIPSRNAAKISCDKGHKFSEENIYRAKNGSRHCRQCRAAWNTNWANENRERRRQLDRESYRRRTGQV